MKTAMKQFVIRRMFSTFYTSFLVLGISVCFLLSTISLCYSQEQPLLSQYMFDRLIINPAYAGSSDMISSTLTYKNKFIGIDGAPRTQVFSIHAPIQTKSMGVGLKAIHDKIGLTNQTSVTAVYAYHLDFTNGKLSFGLEGGILNQSTDFASLRRIDQEDNTLPLNKESVMVPDAAFGVYYRYKKFYSGVSVYHLLQSKLKYAGYERTPFAKLSNHYFLTGGYSIKANENINLEPSLLLKYVAKASLQADMNINATYKEMLTIGASFRTGDAIAIIIQYSFKDRIKFGYAFDYTISELATYNNGSHEIMLSYNIALSEPVIKKPVEPVYEEIVTDAFPVDSLSKDTLTKSLLHTDNDTSQILETTHDEVTIDLDTTIFSPDTIGATSILDTLSTEEAMKDTTTLTKKDTIVTEQPDSSISSVVIEPDLIKFKGFVTANGLGLQNVSVKLFKGSEVIKEIKTSENGEFSFDILLLEGDYSLYVAKDGYIDKFYEISTTIKDDDGTITKSFELIRKKF